MDTSTTASTAPTPQQELSTDKVRQMIEACEQGHLHTIQSLVSEHSLYASQQDDATGRSPLMAAAHAGNGALCQLLLEKGAPWNAVDRQGQCAGNYATNAQHWGVVNLLVDWGVQAELILGHVERQLRQTTGQTFASSSSSTSSSSPRPVSHEPSTKPEYLQQRLHYTDNGRALLDADQDAVMMEWERPLMKAHAQMLMQHTANNNTQSHIRKTVLNVGFGMGIIDTILQTEHSPEKHYIIEAHPDVYQKMIHDKWNEKPNVVILFGKWQDMLPQLIQQGVQIDAVFYDTYGEHALDMEDFHALMVQVLSKPHGVYSFFNGLAPDNLFFHGVACQVVKLQLGQLGLDSEFLSCEFQAPTNWQGVRRPYWAEHNNTYYLPVCTWNPQYLQTGTIAPNAIVEQAKQNVLNNPKRETTTEDASAKRQRQGA